MDDFEHARDLFRWAGEGLRHARAANPAKQSETDALVAFMQRVGEARTEAEALLTIVSSLFDVPGAVRWQIFEQWFIADRDDLVRVCREGRLDLNAVVFAFVTALEPRGNGDGT